MHTAGHQSWLPELSRFGFIMVQRVRVTNQISEALDGFRVHIDFASERFANSETRFSNLR